MVIFLYFRTCPFEGHTIKLLQAGFCGLNVEHLMLLNNLSFLIGFDRNPFLCHLKRGRSMSWKTDLCASEPKYNAKAEFGIKRNN